MIVTCGTAMAFLDDAKYTGRPMADGRSEWRRVPRELLTLTWICAGVAFWALLCLVLRAI